MNQEKREMRQFNVWRARNNADNTHNITPEYISTIQYTTPDCTVSSLVCRSRDTQDATQLWIHFGTSEFIQHRNVNMCLEMGHVIYSRTEGSQCLQHLADNADTSLCVNHPEIIYRNRPHTVRSRNAGCERTCRVKEKQPEGFRLKSLECLGICVFWRLMNYCMFSPLAKRLVRSTFRQGSLC